MSLAKLLSSQRPVAIGVITALSAAIAIGLAVFPGTSMAIHFADNVFYDWFYRNRAIESQSNGDVVIVAVDDKSLDEVDRGLGHGWPWPRIAWHMIAAYLQNAGAKAVAFDMLFSENSAKGVEDDATFGSLIDETTVPLAFGRAVTPAGEWGRFKPPIRRAVQFGGTDVTSEKVYRDFIPQRGDKPSLALAAIRAAGLQPRLPVDQPFLMHYYGPHRGSNGSPTFPTWSASRLIAAAADPSAPNLGITPDLFKGKIVVVGVVAEGLQDIKSAPNSPRMPGVEIQATAIANLLRGQSARPVGLGWAAAIALAAAFLTAGGTVRIRNAVAKATVVGFLVAAVMALSFLLFRRAGIVWLPPTMSLLTIVMAAIGGISWSYFLEDRQARMLLKALETCLSPSVAAELAANPRRLAVGGRQLEMTVMFTDLAGFTSLAERLKERIEPALNYYLAEMTEQILAVNGTLDKYIGDGIMSFWNAPLRQPDHAVRACEAALAIQRREREVRDQLESLGMTNVLTRIGINSGLMFVGFTGSHRKLDYTVIGDAVNRAARLEPANKIYGTQICAAEDTVTLARGRYLFRMLDLLAVKGKNEPMAVYELMGEATLAAGAKGTLAREFERALNLYLQQRWDAADQILLELQQQFPDDGPCKTLRKRIDEFRKEPPPEDWDGVYRATST